METTIVVADSRRLIREGIVALLAGRPDFKVVAQAADGRQALEQIVELSPTVTIFTRPLRTASGKRRAQFRVVQNVPSGHATSVT